MSLKGLSSMRANVHEQAISSRYVCYGKAISSMNECLCKSSKLQRRISDKYDRLCIGDKYEQLCMSYKYECS
jgi:hypothetical protein